MRRACFKGKYASLGRCLEQVPLKSAQQGIALKWAVGHIIPDLNILLCAKTLRRRYGRDALFVASWYADVLFDKGDADECAVWKQIVQEIERMVRAETKAAESPN